MPHTLSATEQFVAASDVALAGFAATVVEVAAAAEYAVAAAP